MSRTSSLVGHDALRGGYDRNAQAAQHAGQLIRARIDAQTWLGHTAQPGDNLLLAGTILQSDADHALSAVVNELEALDLALIQQDLSDGLLHVGSRHIDRIMLGVVRVADTGQHIRNRISDLHEF